MNNKTNHINNTKNTKHTESSNPETRDCQPLSADIICALESFGHVSRLRDGTTCIRFTPAKWERMQRVVQVEDDAFDAYLMKDPSGLVVQSGHTGARMTPRCEFRKSDRARAPRAKGPCKRQRNSTSEPTAQLPDWVWDEVSDEN